MRISLDVPGRTNLIRAYSPGSVRIGERTFATSLIVTAATLFEDWRPRSVDDLQATDFEPVLALKPEVVLLGSGVRQQFPPRELIASLHAARVGLEVMDTGAACRTYNLLVAEGREVVAALLL